MAKKVTNIPRLIRTLEKFNTELSSENEGLKIEIIKVLTTRKLDNANWLFRFNEFLLWNLAYPSSQRLYKVCLAGLNNVERQLKVLPPKKKESLLNTGLPHTMVQGIFSRELVTWMALNFTNRTELDSFAEDGVHPQEVLRLLFPLPESEVIAMEDLNPEEFADEVYGNSKLKLKLLCEDFNRSHLPVAAADYLFDSLKLFVNFYLDGKHLSRSFLRSPHARVFYHDKIQKHLDFKSFIETPISEPITLDSVSRQSLVSTMRLMLLSLSRETDPITSIDEDNVELFELERGLSICLMGIRPDKRLAFESYIGYMAFKNGLPIAYGGSWLFGKRALFGINIFESFRGGESALIFCSLLRLYHKRYGVSYFEVEPYQYGEGNPEGIKTGAFWFYYRFGFRPLDKNLSKIAAREFDKILRDKSYRTSEKILESFTASNIYIHLADEKVIPPSALSLSEGISALIRKGFKGNRALAIQKAVSVASEVFGQIELDILNDTERNSCENFALLYLSLNPSRRAIFNKGNLWELAIVKARDERLFQELFLKLNFS